VVGDLDCMDDPEIDHRLDPPRAGSHTVTFGEPYRTRTVLVRERVRSRHYLTFRQRIAFETVLSSTLKCCAILKSLRPKRRRFAASSAWGGRARL
jgi:hypothetical protein